MTEVVPEPEEPKTPIEELQEATSLSRDELIDHAVVAVLGEGWTSGSEALSSNTPKQP